MITKLLLPLFFLILSFALPSTMQAQPGWMDYTIYFNYTILDEEGKEIVFRENEAYEIRIDSLSFSGASIPNDPLEPAIENVTIHFENYFRINDCSFRRPQGNPVKIQIIHQKDTMHFYGIRGDMKLQFRPGYHYLWPGYLADNFGTVSGKVSIKNAHQSNVIIPKQLYQRLTAVDYEDSEAKKEVNELVLNNFMEAAGLQVHKEIAPTQFSQSFPDYEKPKWDSPFHATRDSHLYVGLVSYTHSPPKQQFKKSVFSILNKRENTINHWAPKDRLRQFNTYKLRVDTFNKVLYNITSIREKYDAECKSWSTPECPYQQKMFYSNDDGQHWVEDSLSQQFYDQHGFIVSKFLDKTHALAFRLRDIKGKRIHRIKQGTYYLVKDGGLIDSLQTPDTVDYRNNYNRYQFSRDKDTITLGSWIPDPYNRNKRSQLFYQPLLIKHNAQWRFKVLVEPIEKYSKAIAADPETSVKAYQNFMLRDNRILEFNNGAGTLTLNREVLNPRKGIYTSIVEDGMHIYILESTFTLLSFDGGTSWFVYPKPLDKSGDYNLLEANQQQEISFFNLRKIQKVVYQFSFQE